MSVDHSVFILVNDIDVACAEDLHRCHLYCHWLEPPGPGASISSSDHSGEIMLNSHFTLYKQTNKKHLISMAYDTLILLDVLRKKIEALTLEG